MTDRNNTLPVTDTRSNDTTVVSQERSNLTNPNSTTSEGEVTERLSTLASLIPAESRNYGEPVDVSITTVATSQLETTPRIVTETVLQLILNWKGDFNSTTTYTMGDLIRHLGSVYIFISETDSTSSDPSTDSNLALFVEKGNDGVDGQDGTNGESAYQLATNGGFVGTEAEWLSSLKGDKGDTGDIGPQGLQGDKGDTGETGPQGIQGLQGDRGDTGDTGLQGIQGLQGDTGPQGERGIQGNTGSQGLAGIQGEQGLQGTDGQDGQDGQDGADSTVPGPKGDTGDIGLQGIQGLQGDTGAQGERGIQGNTGPQGLDGVQGEQGLQGVDGQDGIDGQDGADSTVPGPKGDTGDIGLQGDTGAQGDTGPQGERGIQGNTGPQGLDGVQGEQGLQGEQGIQGEAGADSIVPGPKGDKGETGPQGAGVAGQDGQDGQDGVDGQDGADSTVPGPKGDPGSSGGSVSLTEIMQQLGIAIESGLVSKLPTDQSTPVAQELVNKHNYGAETITTAVADKDAIEWTDGSTTVMMSYWEMSQQRRDGTLTAQWIPTNEIHHSHWGITLYWHPDKGYIWTVDTFHSNWTELRMREDAGIEIRLKSYHTNGYGYSLNKLTRIDLMIGSFPGEPRQNIPVKYWQ